jgi:molybdate transport system substrate-binding protein
MKTILSFLVVTLFGQPVSGEDLKVYAAAAFKAPITEIAAQYEAATGNKVTLSFDTAGGTEQKFRQDSQASLLITTVTVIDDAVRMGRLKDGTTYRLGDTLAGIAYYPGSAKPDVSTPEKLKAALLGAKRIVFSDPSRGATAGIHFMKVIESLGVKDEVLRKATLAKDGPDTMRLLLEEKIDLGVTQISEILQANPGAVAGPFPKEFELTTVYSVWYRNNVSQPVKAFAAFLDSPANRAKLAENGIRPVANR